MFGSTALEIAIGLLFLFLCVSLVCTSLNELIAAATRARAKELERGIRNLLDGTSRYPLPFSWSDRLRARPGPPTDSWASRLLNHQLINGLSRDGEQPSYIPSSTFITVLMQLIGEEAGPAEVDPNAPELFPPLSGAATFTQIGDALRRISTNPPLRAALLGLLEEARGDLRPGIPDAAKFQGRVQIWYDHAMERVGGWYKRRTQRSILLIALAVTAVANVDSIAVFRALCSHSAVRDSVVAAATAFAGTARPPTSQPANGPEAQGRDVLPAALQAFGKDVGRLQGLDIPLGWVSYGTAHPSRSSELSRAEAALDAADRRVVTLQRRLEEAGQANGPAARDARDVYDAAVAAAKPLRMALDAERVKLERAPIPDNVYDLFVQILPRQPATFFTKVLGILLTAIAASLGAPFWFDLLNRFVSIRAAGKAPEERPKDPKRVLQPESP